MIGYRARVRGCLLGGAIGDALGAPIEFDSADGIRQRFGPSGLAGLVPLDGRIGAVTDDTQLTLFTVDGLIRARTGGTEPAAELWSAYRRWLATQDGSAAGPAPGWLFGQRWLHARRSPGQACLSGLAGGVAGRLDAPRNPDSKGCGAVMRSAPFGLLQPVDTATAFRLAVAAAVHTHGHPTGYLAAGAMAAIVHRVTGGSPLPEAARATLAELGRWPGHEETSAAVEAAVSSRFAAGTPSMAVLAALGEGWVADEALAIGLYCALTCAEPGEVREALLLAVNHSGDSDSTGSICGNLLGALFGEEALPPDWVVVVEGRDTITRLADDLALAVHHAPAVRDLPAWRERYPPVNSGRAPWPGEGG
ncbi:MAG TPA: ADP-ribosylglycohydrolase family protein [Pseudonocardiaceae bacterium]|nr:ADP-ribosylglycohydrolase family protein [Pseudonocardiaceae bacterium]